MMAPTLIRISCDDHIRHHFIEPYGLFLLRFLKKMSKVCYENGVFDFLFLVPVAISFVPEGGSGKGRGNLERQGGIYFI
jgi:hypothetical protein